MPYIGRGSNVGDGLTRSSDVYRLDPRDQVSRSVILLVGGESNVNTGNEIRAADDLRNQLIRVVTIGKQFLLV